jgi:hypothetical protein
MPDYVYVELNIVNTCKQEAHPNNRATLLLFDKDKNVIWKAP